MAEADEGWAEWAEQDPDLVREYYAMSPPNMRLALDAVRAHAPERSTYAQIETELGWPPGRLARVIGGTRARRGSYSTRPYHICPPDLSPSGEWEIWMDELQARSLTSR
jgi:hypothetical protein